MVNGSTDERVLSIFLAKKWPPSFILMTAEGWEQKEIYTRRGSTVKIRRGGGVKITPAWGHFSFSMVTAVRNIDFIIILLYVVLLLISFFPFYGIVLVFNSPRDVKTVQT